MFDPLLPWRARAAGRVNAVLVTHSHVDHLNRWSLKAIDRAAHLVVPIGCKDIVKDLGFSKVTEVLLPLVVPLELEKPTSAGGVPSVVHVYVSDEGPSSVAADAESVTDVPVTVDGDALAEVMTGASFVVPDESVE